MIKTKSPKKDTQNKCKKKKLQSRNIDNTKCNIDVESSILIQTSVRPKFHPDVLIGMNQMKMKKVL